MGKPQRIDDLEVGMTVSKTFPGLTVAFINSTLAAVGYVKLPDGQIDVDPTIASIIVPSDCKLDSSPQTVLNAIGDGPIITSLDTVNVTVCGGMTMTRDPGTVGDGIQFYGDNHRYSCLTIRECFTGLYCLDRTALDGLQSGFIQIDRCRIEHTTATGVNSQFGIQLNTVNYVEMWSTHVSGYWLDGVKARRLVNYLQWFYGTSNDNGQSLGFGASGDGFDGFAGCSVAVIHGVTMSGNGGNGIVLKTLNNATPATNPSNPQWGAIRSHMITSCFFDDNEGTGVAIEGVVDADLPPGDITRPRVSMTHVGQCITTNGTNYGYFANGFQATFSQCTARNNGLEGIIAGPQARDLYFDKMLNWGNGASVAGTIDNARCISGAARVKFSYCSSNGAAATDTDYIITDATYAGLTRVSRYPIFTESGCSEIYVQWCYSQFAANDLTNIGFPVATTQGASSTLWVNHQTLTGNPNNRFYGGIGSRIDSGALGGISASTWVKTRGNPNDQTGWFQLLDGQDNGFYGDGSDGDTVIAAGTTTAARDMYYNTLHVLAGGILDMAGFRIFVRGNTSSTVAGVLGWAGALTVDVGGTIRNNGGAAVAGAAGAAAPAGTLGASFAGGAGGLAAGTAGTNATNTTRLFGAVGGPGGLGTGGAGGAGGTITNLAAANGDVRSVQSIIAGATLNNTQVRGGAGGGGGGGDLLGVNAGGGGGGGGGVLVIAARTITNNGAIEARGGAGAAGTAVDTGGGGGGGGGLVLVVADGVVTGNAIDVSGGAAGASGGGAGVAGTAGTLGLVIFVRP